MKSTFMDPAASGCLNRYLGVLRGYDIDGNGFDGVELLFMASHQQRLFALADQNLGERAILSALFRYWSDLPQNVPANHFEDLNRRCHPNALWNLFVSDTYFLSRAGDIRSRRFDSIWNARNFHPDRLSLSFSLSEDGNQERRPLAVSGQSSWSHPSFEREKGIVQTEARFALPKDLKSSFTLHVTCHYEGTGLPPLSFRFAYRGWNAGEQAHAWEAERPNQSP